MRDNRMGKFIYVFDTESKIELISLGYTLVKDDPSNSVFVFENNPQNTHLFSVQEYVLTDTLTF